MRPSTLFLLLAVSVVVVELRLVGVRDDVFKDCAHVWAGVLLGGWWLHQPGPERRLCRTLALTLIVAEVVCFFFLRGPK